MSDILTDSCRTYVTPPSRTGYAVGNMLPDLIFFKVIFYKHTKSPLSECPTVYNTTIKKDKITRWTEIVLWTLCKKEFHSTSAQQCTTLVCGFSLLLEDSATCFKTIDWRIRPSLLLCMPMCKRLLLSSKCQIGKQTIFAHLTWTIHFSILTVSQLSPIYADASRFYAPLRCVFDNGFVISKGLPLPLLHHQHLWYIFSSR